MSGSILACRKIKRKRKMKRTKIICTMGPNTNDKKLMKDMAIAGMDVARFNFSHGDYEEHLGRLNILREVREETGKEVAALLDTKGPEIRTGLLEGGNKVTLVAGNEYTLTINECVGNDKKGFINYSGLNEDVKAGDKILIDDGLIALEVINVDGPDIHTKVLNGGELGEKKGVNVPGVSIKLPALTQKDIEDIKFACDNGFEFIAASFIRNGDAVRQIKAILAEKHANIQVISKIENQEGIDNMDDIIEASDGIMVARGDMGVEIDAARLPFIQKKLIEKCSVAGKPVITATQMLDSMIRNPRPTRAEVSDVANAIYDGTDAIMLSGESAMGKYPLEALKMMVKIAKETEIHLDHTQYRNRKVNKMDKKNISNQVGYAAVSTADQLEAKAIIAPSISGFTTRMLSKWRSTIPVYGMSPSITTIRQMQLLYGVVPVFAKRADTTDVLIESSIDILKKEKYLKSGDLVVVTAGIIPKKADRGPARYTNTMQVETVK